VPGGNSTPSNLCPVRAPYDLALPGRRAGRQAASYVRDLPYRKVLLRLSYLRPNLSPSMSTPAATPPIAAPTTPPVVSLFVMVSRVSLVSPEPLAPTVT